MVEQLLSTKVLGRVLPTPVGSKIAIFGLKSPRLRTVISKQLQRFIQQRIIDEDISGWHPALQRDKRDILLAMLASGMRGIEKGLVGENSIKKLVDLLLNRILLKDSVYQLIDAFKENYGVRPPGFIVLSPTGGCNLQCTGCYAGSLPSVSYTHLTLPTN